MVSFDKKELRKFRYFDWLGLSLILLLLAGGLIAIFSATYTPTRPFSLFFKKQCLGIVFGLISYALCCILDVRRLMHWGYWCYFITIGFLVYTIIGGWVGLGAQRWISLYFFRFQPSELIKLFFPFFVTAHFATYTTHPREHLPFSFTAYAFPLIVLAATFLLILKQPDLGTALIILASGTIILWIAGLPKRFFIIVSILGALSAPFLWQTLHPYQQRRILVLLGIGMAKPDRYQMEQAKIAIGSGKIWGKGFLKGTQNKLLFLPEDHTDFIFAVICEEIGFVGASLLLLLFTFLFLHHLFRASQLPYKYDQLIYVGILIPLILSFLINVGMVIGLLPIVGIPLPFISYGLTHTLITIASFGILNTIVMEQRIN